MSTYKVALGHDVALESLTDIDPQPHTPGLEYARRSYAVDGTVEDEYPHVNLEFRLPLTVTQLQALYTQFGVGSAKTAEVTVYVQDSGDAFSWQRLNGVAVQPLMGADGARDGFFVQGLVILVKRLQTPAS